MPDILGTLKVPRLAAAPGGPVVGQTYYDTIANEVRWYNGTAWIPAKGGTDLSFDGDWVAGTYQEGDTVVKDGVLFMCVGGPTSAVPDPTLWGLASTTASYGTTLPASPVDGQEAILVDSTTNPTYTWRFRYNAGSSSAYRWEFIGGTPQTGYIGPNSPTNAPNAPAIDTGMGTIFTLPRAGDYVISYQVTCYNSAQGYYTVRLYVGGAAVVNGHITHNHDATTGEQPNLTLARSVRASGVAAASAVQLWHEKFATTNCHVSEWSCQAIPARVA